MAELSVLSPAAQAGLRADAGDLPLAVPTTPGDVLVDGARRTLWLGPDEWLVVDDATPAAALVGELEAAAGEAFATVVDLSSNRVVLVLEGPDAREILETAITIDLHPRAFGDRRCAQTLFAKAQVILERDGEAWRLYVRPSFAGYVTGWLEDAMNPLGGSSGSPAAAR